MKRSRLRASAVLLKTATLSMLLALLAITFGCSRKLYSPEFVIRKSHEPTLDLIANAYVRIALELGERDPDSLDFAVVAPALREAVHRGYPSLDTIDRETTQLLAQLENLSTSKEQLSRAQFLEGQLRATQARIAMLRGHTLGFASEARILFQAEPLPVTAGKAREAFRTQIAALLPRLHQGPHTPAAAYAAYNQRFLISPDRLPSVMNAALASCRRQTLAYLPLPANESVDLTFVRNRPWSAFSRFHGNAHSTIQINLDFPVTVDQALELACHEGYPGHHVFNTLRDIALVQQRHLPEAQVQLTFSPQSYLSESAAAYAPRLAFTDEERTQIERDILFPLAGLPPREAAQYVTICSLIRKLDTAEPAIARQYIDGDLEFVRAAQRLRAVMLMEHSEATLLYLNEYRSYMLAYTDGPSRIAALLGATQDDSRQTQDERRQRWQRYARLMQDPSESIHLP